MRQPRPQFPPAVTVADAEASLLKKEISFGPKPKAPKEEGRERRCGGRRGPAKRVV
jgi:hypothetical protein